MKRRIWLSVVAAGVFPGVSAGVYNLLGWSNARAVVYGGIVGLMFAACDHYFVPGWWSRSGSFAVQVPLGATLVALVDLLSPVPSPLLRGPFRSIWRA
jgi:hypothetical protein